MDGGRRLTAVARTRLSDFLILELARDIVGRRLRRGEPLPPEPELAATYGVSKTVVRESLKALASYGLVRVQHGKRTVVLDETNWDVLAETIRDAYRLEGRAPELTAQFYGARLALEVSAATLAAERADDDERSRVARLSDEMTRVARTTRDLRTFLDLDRSFHDAVGAASGNVVLHQVNRRVHEFLVENWEKSKMTVEELDVVAAQHSRIANAIVARNPDEASRAMTEHLLWAQAREVGDGLAGNAVASRPRPATQARSDR
jgi:GntR family transcriptional regulator, galactonate operon transcriptional repressor